LRTSTAIDWGGNGTIWSEKKRRSRKKLSLRRRADEKTREGEGRHLKKSKVRRLRDSVYGAKRRGKTGRPGRREDTKKESMGLRGTECSGGADF